MGCRVEPANQQGKELREVYAHAGAALSNAQTLEHRLQDFIVLAAAIERHTSDAPTSPDDVTRALADLEKFNAEISKQTLGHLVRSTKSQSLLARSEELEANLTRSLDDRNKLVHRFFWDNSVNLMSSRGRRWMAKELKGIQAQLRQTITVFERANKSLQEYMGVTDEMIKKVVELAKAGATEEQLTTLSRQLRQGRSEKTF